VSLLQVAEIEVLNFYGDVCCPIERKTCNLTYAMPCSMFAGVLGAREEEAEGELRELSEEPLERGKGGGRWCNKRGQGSTPPGGRSYGGSEGTARADQGQGTVGLGTSLRCWRKSSLGGRDGRRGAEEVAEETRGGKGEEGVRGLRGITGKRRDPSPRGARQRYQAFPIEDLPNPPRT